MPTPHHHRALALRLLALLLALIPALPARTDVISRGNSSACALVVAAKLSPPAAYRALALAQTAVLEASANIAPGSADEAFAAAIAAANRTVLLKVAPAASEAIESEHARVLAALPAGAAKEQGLAVGERAAQRVLELRAADQLASGGYRPTTTAGVYVPTTLPAAIEWPRRKPWVLASPSALRPAPPPALDSEIWVHDLQEVRRLGAKQGSTRSAEQEGLARFWEATMPAIYFSLVASVADVPARDAHANARLYAVVAQALDDALIATFDAKHHYNFWRPLTAIRNADLDASPLTDSDVAWLPLIETPMHPEYPAAHASLAASLAAVLRSEFGRDELELSASSPTAPGVVRHWTSLQAFVNEVGEARICAGVHFRNSVTVGTELGAKAGALVVEKFAASR